MPHLPAPSQHSLPLHLHLTFSCLCYSLRLEDSSSSPSLTKILVVFQSLEHYRHHPPTHPSHEAFLTGCKENTLPSSMLITLALITLQPASRCISAYFLACLLALETRLPWSLQCTHRCVHAHTLYTQAEVPFSSLGISQRDARPAYTKHSVDAHPSLSLSACHSSKLKRDKKNQLKNPRKKRPGTGFC